MYFSLMILHIQLLILAITLVGRRSFTWLHLKILRRAPSVLILIVMRTCPVLRNHWWHAASLFIEWRTFLHLVLTVPFPCLLLITWAFTTLVKRWTFSFLISRTLPIPLKGRTLYTFSLIRRAIRCNATLLFFIQWTSFHFIKVFFSSKWIISAFSHLCIFKGLASLFAIFGRELVFK